MTVGISRRELLRYAALATACGPFAGCCKSQPTILSPVSYGVQSLGMSDGAPTDLLVYYPSLDRQPRGAAILDCVPYPAVLVVHGLDTDRFSWQVLSSTLARCGYVVAVPETLNAGPVPSDASIEGIVDVHGWLRRRKRGSHWIHSGLVDSAAATIGHSFGAGLAGLAAAAIGASTTAYVSLGGGVTWNEWGGSGPPVDRLAFPTLFVSGRVGDPPLDASIWTRLARPKHELLLALTGHFDYVPRSAFASPPADDVFRCDVPEVASAFVAAFLSKYVPPRGSSVESTIPDSLLPPSSAAGGTVPAAASPFVATLAGAAGFTHRWETGPLEHVVDRPYVAPACNG